MKEALTSLTDFGEELSRGVVRKREMDLLG